MNKDSMRQPMRTSIGKLMKIAYNSRIWKATCSDKVIAKTSILSMTDCSGNTQEVFAGDSGIQFCKLY